MLAVSFAEPYYSGNVATADEVPGLFPVGLGGRTYLIDLLSGEFRRRTIPLIRQQADNQDQPGEHSINPEDLWRRFQQDWSHGAGQTYYDRDSDPSRYRLSKGVDPWTKWELSLLPDTDEKRSTAGTNLYMAVAGTRLYITDGTTLAYTTDVTAGTPTFTDVTGTPGAATSITSDGFNVWTAHSASGIYATTRTSGSTASYVTGTVTLVRYLKGRLMAAAANSIYNVIAAGALPTALLTHANTDFLWVDMAESRTHIYMAGYAGDKSLIYSTTIRPDGTALEAPSVAGELPDGEIVRSMKGYLGFIAIGTDKGIRFCNTDSAGKLTLGSLIPTTAAVFDFEGQDRFIWFGWTNYDAVSTGLGRIDLSVFTQPLTPAYASDLMVTGQGAVQSIVTFQNLRVFSVSGDGFYAETTDKVTTGTLESGLITYGIPDTKMAVFMEIRHEALAGSVSIALSADGDVYDVIGGSNVAGSTGESFGTGQVLGSTFETRLTLTRAAVTTTGPTVTRATLRSYPIPARGEFLTVPLVLHESLDVNGTIRTINPREEFNFIKSLVSNQTLVAFQFGSETLSVFVDDYDWSPTIEMKDNSGWAGICTVKLKSVVD